MPIILEKLFSNISICLGLITLFIIVGNVVQVIAIYRASNKTIHVLGVIIISIMIITLLMTFLQVYVDPDVCRGIKLIFFIIICLIATSYLNYLVGNIFKMIYNISENRTKTKLIVCVVIFNIYMTAVMLTQLVACIYLLSGKFKNSTPHITFDMITFPIYQMVGLSIILVYTKSLPDFDNLARQNIELVEIGTNKNTNSEQVA